MAKSGDYHLHTTLSDGRATAREIVESAAKRGLFEIAITDHSFSGLRRRMTQEKFDLQAGEIDVLRDMGVKLYHGVEANILNEDGDVDLPREIMAKCDVLIAGFHRFVPLALSKESRKFVLVNGYSTEYARQKMREYNTAAFINAICRYPIDVIAHPGHRTPVDFGAVCAEMAKRDVYFELNERHLADTKGLDEEMDVILKSGVKFILGSDSHAASNVGKFDGALQFAKKYGVERQRLYGIDGNLPSFKNKKEFFK